MCNCKISALSAVTPTVQTVAVDAPVTFSTTNLLRGCDIRFLAGSSAITLCTPGEYLITFSADITEDTAAGTVSAQITRNGVAIPGVVTSVTSAATVTSLSISTVVRVLPSCAAIDNTTQISVVNTGAVSGNFTNTNITITKI